MYLQRDYMGQLDKCSSLRVEKKSSELTQYRQLATWQYLDKVC